MQIDDAEILREYRLCAQLAAEAASRGDLTAEAFWRGGLAALWGIGAIETAEHRAAREATDADFERHVRRIGGTGRRGKR